MMRELMAFGAVALLAWPVSAAAQAAPASADGARVWARNCVRCHNVRPSAERSDAEWAVVVSHMRARANLTRTQARTVTAFLQATNLPEVPVTVLTGPSTEQTAEEVAGSGDPEARAPELSRATLQQLRAYLVRLATLTGPSR